MDTRTSSVLDDEIRALEERLLLPEVRGSREDLETLLAEDFLEFGKSGRRFDRASIVTLLEREPPCACSLESFHVKLLSDAIVLATYTSRASRGGGIELAHRSSIWARRAGRWQLVFHQGTPTSE